MRAAIGREACSGVGLLGSQQVCAAVAVRNGNCFFTCIEAAMMRDGKAAVYALLNLHSFQMVGQLLQCETLHFFFFLVVD